MANNELRNQMQGDAVCAVFEKHRVIVEWGTGVGKSRVAIRTAAALDYAGRTKVLLLVTETAHKTNWRKEFTDALGGEAGQALFDKMTVECYASLKKYENTSWDFIIADEAHHLRSELRTGVLSTLKADYVLCLSATLSDRNDADQLESVLEKTFGSFERFRFTMQDAIENEVLARPYIFTHILSLSDIDDERQITIAWGWPNARHKYIVDVPGYRKMMNEQDRYPAAEVTVTGPAEDLYRILEERQAEASATYKKLRQDSESVILSLKEREAARKKLPFAETQMKRSGLDRKTFLGEIKSDYAAKILRDISLCKYICFCASIAQGQELGGENIIHSKRRDNASVIESFNKGDIRSLFAVGMIQEGANLKGIEAGLVIQLDDKARPFIQKFGRAMRSTCPQQHIIVINHTRDVRYYRNAIAGIDSKYITYIDARSGFPVSAVISEPQWQKETETENATAEPAA